LEGRGGEGRSGIALALLAFDLRHSQPADGVGARWWRAGIGKLNSGGGLQRGFHAVRLFRVGDVKLSQFCAAVFGQAGDKRLGRLGNVGFQGPVFPRLKALDLLLALDDHPQCWRLYPASGQARTDFLP